MPASLSRIFKFPYPILAAILAALLLTAVMANGLLHKQPSPTAFDAPSATDQSQTAADYSQLGSWHLFGEPQTALATDGSADAPAELKLRGVFYLGGHKARAIIETAGQPQKTYQINDTLAGGGIVQDIAPDKVVLRIDNQLSTLPLSRPEPEPDSAPAEPTP